MTRGKKTGILCAVLAVAIIAYFGVKQITKRAEEADMTSVFNIAAEDITGLKWNYNDETIELEKIDGVWRLTDDSETEIEQSDIEEIVNSIAELKASTVIPKEEQTEDYGLNGSDDTVVVSTETADTTYTFGDVNDVTDEYYLKITGSDNVFTVSKDFRSGFETGRDDILAPTPEPTEEVTEEPEAAEDEAAETAAAE